MGYKTYTCPIERFCGGCEWLAVPYPLQLKRKQTQVEELFGEMARQDGGHIAEVVGMAGEPLAYRHKAATPFAPGPRGFVRSGFYARGSHRIVACKSCLVEHPRARQILEATAQVAHRLRIPAYDEDAGRGVLRHAIVRMGWRSGEALLTIVTNGRELRRADEFVAEMRRRCPELTSIVQNVNTRRTNAMLGHESRALWGPGIMHDELLGCRFEIGPTSFYQTNPAQTEALYTLALEAAGLGDGARLLDAYCGTGTIGICAAAHAREEGHEVQVVGVESVADAVACARRNAAANGLGGSCRFVNGDATAWMQKRGAELGHLDAVIMDPPRAGSTPEFLRGVCALAPTRVVYVSCNPQTQARDLIALRKGGYRLERLVPVDMFPHTKHVETVVLLTKCGTMVCE